MRNGNRFCAILSLIVVTLSQLCLTTASDAAGIVANGNGAFAAGTIGKLSSFGYGGSLGISFQPDPTNSPELKLIVRIGYQRFPIDTRDDYKIMSGEIDLKLDYALAREPNIYLIAGAGLAQVESVVKETNPFGSVGLGVEFGRWLLETRATRIAGDHFKETTYFPVTLGLRF